MPQTNVLHIIDTLGIGGAEKVMIGAVNSLPDFQHHVVYLNGSDEMASHLPANCRIKRLNYLSKKYDVPRCAIELNKYIKKNKIDIVHSHLFVSTIIARLACPKNVKLFTTIHSLPSRNYFVGKMAKWLERITYKKRHHLIAICNEVFNDYNHCIGVKGPYTILYNYVEDVYHAKEYKKTEFTDKLRLVAVGNLKPAKNYGYLIEAFKSMPANVQLDIYGSGPLQKQLEDEIKKNNLNIKLCGVREDIQNVLPNYDAFIMSSIFEGQPISLLEAMACGMPAILSDIPVLREATNNKAIFYDLNDVNDLVKKVSEVVTHKVSLDEYAKAGFERVKRIASKENYMVMLRKVYLEHQDYRNQAYQTTPVKIFRPALPAAVS
jgi:glycosyltransferase involved in cell wall biosynthesis